MYETERITSLHFICRREHDEAYQLDNLFEKITVQYEKVLIDEITEGPACSRAFGKTVDQ